MSYFKILGYIPQILQVLSLLSPVFSRFPLKHGQAAEIVAAVFSLVRPWVPEIGNLDRNEIHSITVKTVKLIEEISEAVSS